ncbi:hypothetical protein KIW84_022712 [Lathyrus oleraceus]|uniref:DUF7745 domain-containing protein n=1 Tax=Pisum sativum TaxID=3888 RepID=A0A9D4YD57_PEA|nr:hypothetical protein KIW84_022712 [Pisum sativum]
MVNPSDVPINNALGLDSDESPSSVVVENLELLVILYGVDSPIPVHNSPSDRFGSGLYSLRDKDGLLMGEVSTRDASLARIEFNLGLVLSKIYYDPSLRRFTFKEFQLAPAIEEYEKLLGWYVKDHPPFTKLGELLIHESVVEALHLSIDEVYLGLGPRVFSRKFLEDKAYALEK